MNKKKVKQYIWQDLLIGIVVVLIVFMAQELMKTMKLDAINGLAHIAIDSDLCLNIIITQYTITFLIVSLLSLLSGSDEYVYWVDVLEQKIISPKHLNFTSMSVYAFIFMFAGTVAFFIENNILVLIFFILDVILLVFLTFRMTSVYFGKERLRQNLYSKLEKEIKAYLYEPDEEKRQQIVDKLNSVYENATKLAEKKQFGEVFETDFQLLVKISEIMDEKFDNDLVKILYGNITKLLLIFKDSSDYIFSRLNTQYSPFSNNNLKPHTIEMLQSALGAYFEKVLADGNYQISQNFWISGIYRNLNKSYVSLLKRKNSTGVLFEKDYNNYEGEVLFYHEEYRGLEGLDLLELKHSLVHEKLLRFSKLIYKNSPDLFFKVVNEHGMPVDIMKEIDILSLICENENSNEAIKACGKLTDKLYIFELNRYIDTYNDYEMTYNISSLNGDDGFYKELIKEFKKGAYNISRNYKDMVFKAAFVYNSPEVVRALLVGMNNSLVEIREIISEHFSKAEYKLLFNKDTYEALVNNAQIKDKAFMETLNSICDTYSDEETLCEIAEELLALLKNKNNMRKYAGTRLGYIKAKTMDVREEFKY